MCGSSGCRLGAFAGALLVLALTFVFGAWVTAPAPIDVFLVAGQSNAVGNGGAGAPTVPAGVVLQVLSDGTIKGANDPIGLGTNMVSTGSAWPMFGIYWYAATHRKIAFVPTAVDGVAQEAAADQGLGNWDTTGTLAANAITAQKNAMTELQRAGYAPVFRGILWKQGERDATAINRGTPGCSPANYSAALTTMVGRLRTAFGADTPFYMIRIGTSAHQVDTGFAQIRAEQEAYVASDAKAFMIDHGAMDYPALGLQSVDGIHYSQAGTTRWDRWRRRRCCPPWASPSRFGRMARGGIARIVLAQSPAR